MMLSLKTTVSRPASGQRCPAARAQRAAARVVVVRADKSDALKELEAFRMNAAAKMQQTMDEAETAPATASIPRVLAAQVLEEAAEPAAAAPAGLRELTKDDFHTFLAESPTLVVVDFFTDWCGPCKMIYPELVKLSEELAGRAQICKFNCNAYNKELGKTLAIKVAPTFHLYKGGEKVAEMTGAKVDKLRALIAAHI